jgi:hypothetical protein
LLQVVITSIHVNGELLIVGSQTTEGVSETTLPKAYRQISFLPTHVMSMRTAFERSVRLVIERAQTANVLSCQWDRLQ